MSGLSSYSILSQKALLKKKKTAERKYSENTPKNIHPNLKSSKTLSVGWRAKETKANKGRTYWTGYGMGFPSMKIQ